jgi:predicted ATP-grasp superfamily ATP-dependent carboligase
MTSNRRVFVSEYFSSGAVPASSLTRSLRNEGHAMLRSVAADISRIDGFTVVTTLDKDSRSIEGIESIRTTDPLHEWDCFQRLVRESSDVLVIAPETDGVLARRVRLVQHSRTRSWNCSVDAIDLCADKYLLFEFLKARSFATIPTSRVNLNSSDAPPFPWPVVLKPRDGAGSVHTFLCSSMDAWRIAGEKMRAAMPSSSAVVQPFIFGQPLSVGANVSLDGFSIDVLPVAEQSISSDGHFRYQGGSIPASISNEATRTINDLVAAVIRAIPGIAGYIGFDLILTELGQPVIVEINPRLTTSYIGYRELFSSPIPASWLNPKALSSLSRTTNQINFTLTDEGEVILQPNPSA